MKTNSKPNIRFKGYTDDWEQRKVDEVTTSYSGGTPQAGNSEYYNGTIPFIRSGEIYKNHAELFITQKGLENSSAKMVSKGDILYALYGATSGEVSRSNINGAINQAILAITPNKGYNADFIVEWFRNEKENIIDKYLQGGQGNLSAQIIKNLEIPFPTFEEQEKVGGIFTELNHLITLHQRKCDQTKELKKFMLQKMFPKKGEKNPEIRFPGFTDDWEQRKLGEIAERVQGNDGRMDLPTLTISAANGWMDQKERFSGNIAGKEQKNYTLLHKGELSYNHGNSKLAKYGAVFSLETYEEALVPRVYHSFKVINGSSKFIEYYFATKIPDRELAKLVSSGARMDGLLNINFNEFMGINLTVPNKSEQEKISNYFSNLDHLITLHQRKCEQLKELKKFMLQNMFPKKG